MSQTDDALFAGIFGTDAMRHVFSDTALVQRWLDVEAALARAQAALGLIPQDAATEITAQAWAGNVEMAAIRDGTALVGYPIVALVDQLRTACAGEAGRWVHWGATTQDIMDSATVLQVRDGLALVEADLAGICAALEGLARSHRDTAMAGRTHLQQALPITFGFKAATWLAPLRRHRQRLAELRPRVLVAQFGGAVGTLASLGPDGLEVAAALAAELDLAEPQIAWHAARDGLAETAGFLALLTGSLGKVAADIALMAQSEVAELAEPYVQGRGSSSTMPQKRNPIACEFVLAAARGVRQQAAVMHDALIADHERATGPWHAEWRALPEAFLLTAGALAHLRAVLEGLEVDAEQMRRNLDLTQGLIVAEAVMMALAPATGRTEAHHLVKDACARAADEGVPLLEALAAMHEVTAHLDRDRLARLLDPATYTGQAGALVDRVLATGA